MNILFLMGGNDDVKIGTCLHNVGEVNNSCSLIKNLIDNFTVPDSLHTKFIFIINKNESEKYFTKKVIKLIASKAEIIEVQNETKGTACTGLLGIEYINNDEPLIIVNGYVIIEENIKPIITYFQNYELDGGILTFNSTNPRYSYVKCDEDGDVVEVAEKTISNMATAGVYYFKKGRYFVDSAMNLIRKGIDINGEYYVSTVYNEMILKLLKIKIFNIERKNISHCLKRMK